MEDTLDKEVRKRIRRRIAMKKTRTAWIIWFNVFGAILLYIVLWATRGRDYAIQNIYVTLVTILSLDFFAYIGEFGYLMFHEFPEEIFQEQRKIIDERLPNQLSLDIKRTPNVLTRNGKDFRAIALLVTSLEKKKIVEFQALISFEHFYCVKGSNFVRETDYQYNAPLYWIGSEPAETQIELRPDTGKVVLISELRDGMTKDGENIRVALMCCNPTPTSAEFGEESIYQVKILFQGKLEGEYDFRTFHYTDIVYTKPEDRRLLFLDQAEKAYSDISKRLLERSKDVIRYMENEEKRHLGRS